METKLVVKKITVEQMLDRPEKAYNPKTWKESIERVTKYKDHQFYVMDPDGVFSYAMFYHSYVAPSGLYLFNDFSAYSSCLTSNGFCIVCIDEEGKVHRNLFKNLEDVAGYAENTPANRKMIIEKISSVGVMVSNSI